MSDVDVRRWSFDHDGWVATRAALTLPARVAHRLPPVPLLGDAAAAAVPAAVEPTLPALTAALVVAGAAPVTVEVVRHHAGWSRVTRHGCAGTAVGGMTVATSPGTVAVGVEMGTVAGLVPLLAEHLGLRDTAADVHRAAEGTTITAGTAALADGHGLPTGLWRAVGGDGASADHDVIEVDGPYGAVAAALVRQPDGTPAWVRAQGPTLQLHPTSDARVRAWLGRTLAAQLAATGTVTS